MKAWFGMLTCLLIASWSGARCQTVTGRTFLLSTDGRTWSDAWTLCHSQGYRLLYLDSPATLNALAAFVEESVLTDTVKDSVWIGLSKDEESEDDFRWDDCLALNSSFTKWPGDEPVNTEGNSCVYMETDTFVWRTDSCQSDHQYLCEKDTGPCTYTYATGTCGATSKVYNRVEKQQDCEELCNTEKIYGAPCWVYNYNNEECTLYFDEDPFRCAHYLDNRTIFAGLRNCFEFEVLLSSGALISQRVLKCNAATTTITTSATTVVAAATTTSAATTDEATTTTTSATTATSTTTGAARTTTTTSATTVVAATTNTSAATTDETTTTTTSATTATSTTTGVALTTTTTSAATTDTTITTTTTSATTIDETATTTTITTSPTTTDATTITTSTTIDASTTTSTATTATTTTTSPTTTDAASHTTSATTTSSSKAASSSTTTAINGTITIAATDSSAVTNISLYNAAANTTSTVSISTRSTTVATGPSVTNADTTSVTSTTSPSLTSAAFTPTSATAHSNPTSSVVTTASTTPAYVSSQVSNAATPSVESTTDACPCMICIPVRNMTLIDDFVKDMIDRLKVDQSTLSSQRRMRESEPDDRPSAQAIGYGGILFLVFTFSIIVAVDFTRICQVRNKRIPERQKKTDPNC